MAESKQSTFKNTNSSCFYCKLLCLKRFGWLCKRIPAFCQSQKDKDKFLMTVEYYDELYSQVLFHTSFRNMTQMLKHVNDQSVLNSFAQPFDDAPPK